jgi:hypothetical protein
LAGSCHVRANAPQHFAPPIGAVSLSARTVLLTFWIQVRIAFAVRKRQRRDFSFGNQVYFNSAALEPLVSKFQDKNSLLHIRAELKRREIISVARGYEFHWSRAELRDERDWSERFQRVP